MGFGFWGLGFGVWGLGFGIVSKAATGVGLLLKAGMMGDPQVKMRARDTLQRNA